MIDLGFHTMSAVLPMKYEFSKYLLRNVLQDHPHLHVKQNEDGTYGRIVGDYTYYDILFKRYSGISFELSIPNRPHIDDGIACSRRLCCSYLYARINIKF